MLRPRSPRHPAPSALVGLVGLAGLVGLIGLVGVVGAGSAGCTTTARLPTSLPVSAEEPPGPEPRGEPAISAEAYRAVLEAELKMQAGDVPAAIALLREAVLHDAASAYLRVRLAEAYLEAGDVEQARAAATAALDIDRSFVPALRVVGASHAAAGDHDAARRAWNAALRLAPADRDTSMLLAELLVENGDLDGAERTIAALMEHEPGAVDGFLALARVFAERGEVERAFAHVEHALERESDDVDALGLKLTLLWSLGRFEEALPVARATGAAAGDEPGVRRDLLSAHALAGAKDDAAALASAWLDDDDSEDMRLLVADGWERAGDVEAALLALDPPKSAPLSPRSAAEAARLHLARRDATRAAGVLCPLAALPGATGPVAEIAAATCTRALLRAGKVKEAGALVEERLSALGKVPRLLNALTDVAVAGGAERARALVVADDALTETPADALVVDASSRAHEELGDIEGARRILDDALRARPMDPELLFALARHLERQHQPLPAVEIVERLMDRGRSGVAELNFAAFTLAEANTRLDDARRYAWRALVADPLNGYVVDTLGWCELMDGDVERAVATLRRADRLSPGEGEILFHLATAEAQHGDRRAALAAAERARSLLDDKDRVRPRVDALIDRLKKAGT